MAGLLDGVKVVEAAVLLSGDYVGMLLGDEGADVVKVESPGTGDWIRDHMGAVAPRYSPYHLFINRNKRSLSLDLKSPAGQEIVRALLADADVFVTGFTGTVPARLGLSYDDVRAIKPDIVYAQVTGFGAEGPYASLPTHGQMMQALVGSPKRMRGPDGHPVLAPGTVHEPAEGTTVGPLYGAFAVAAALHRRDRTGEGSYIDVSCADAVLAGSYHHALLALNEGRYTDHAMAPAVDGRLAARYTYYETGDGKFLLFCPEELKFWRSFCEAVGRPDLIAKHDPNVINDFGADDYELYDDLQRIFLTRTLEEWVALFIEHRVPGGPALSFGESQHDPHIRWRGMVVDEQHPVAGEFRTVGDPIRVRDQEFRIRVHAPAVGEHSADILGELGYSAEQIADLRARAVI